MGEFGTILRTSDGGHSCAPQVSGTGPDLWGVSFADARHGTAVRYGGTILTTTDGGSNWVSQSSGTGGPLTGVSRTDANIGTVTGGRSNPQNNRWR